MNALTGLESLQIFYWFYAKQPWDTLLTAHHAARDVSHPREGQAEQSGHPTVVGWSSSSSSSPTPAQHPQLGLCCEGRPLTELHLQTWLPHKLYGHPEKSLAASFPPTCPPGQLCWKIPSSLPRSTEQGFDSSWKKMF